MLGVHNTITLTNDNALGENVFVMQFLIKRKHFNKNNVVKNLAEKFIKNSFKVLLNY